MAENHFRPLSGSHISQYVCIISDRFLERISVPSRGLIFPNHCSICRLHVHIAYFRPLSGSLISQ